MDFIKHERDVTPPTDRILLLRILKDTNKIMYTTGIYLGGAFSKFQFVGSDHTTYVTHYLPIEDPEGK